MFFVIIWGDGRLVGVGEKLTQSMTSARATPKNQGWPGACQKIMKNGCPPKNLEDSEVYKQMYLMGDSGPGGCQKIMTPQKYEAGVMLGLA